MKLTQQQTDRFWAKVKICGNLECWEWNGGKKGGGYGQFAVGSPRKGGKRYGAHVVAFALANGYMPRLDVLHSCDNPSCCNPRHLSEGTKKQNMRDMYLKNRGRQKLTAEQVVAIRQTKGEPKDLAKQFGVSVATVRAVVNRDRWAWL